MYTSPSLSRTKARQAEGSAIPSCSGAPTRLPLPPDTSNGASSTAALTWSAGPSPPRTSGTAGAPFRGSAGAQRFGRAESNTAPSEATRQ
eukprot:10323752-Lingulodinium_polyedra.AAC.1